MRRTLAALDVSVVTWKRPISAVVPTCVPPQSSRDTPSTSTIRTQSPYFSPKSAIAPRRSASSRVVCTARTGWLATTQALTAFLDIRQLLLGEPLAVREVEAQLVRTHVGARLADVRAEALAQRGVQQVRGGVVAHRGEARAPVHHSPGALPLAHLALDGLELDGLVVPDPEDIGHPCAARLGLDQPGVGDLAASLGVERALLELREQAAVVGLERADDRLPLGGLVAHEAGLEPAGAGELS